MGTHCLTIPDHRIWNLPAGAQASVILVFFYCTSAIAINIESGDLFGSWDTTLSYGISARVADRDDALVSVAHGGQGFSSNIDNGNLNYNDGDLFSNVIKATSEVELNYRDAGVFVRGSAFYDFQVEDGSTRRTEFSSQARDLVGSRARLLDAYGWYRFGLGDIPGEIRVGNQVLSWGESSFIQNGINSINPVDVTALRVPGSELKEALLPVPMVVLNFATTDDTSLELFYQWAWKKTEIDPPGSYFSTSDFAGDSADRVVLGRGTYPDGTRPDGSFAPASDTFQAVPRAPDREASDSPQFGVALRWLVPELNDTEFGFYFFNNHSGLPIVSAVTGTLDGALTAGAIQGPAANPAAGSGAQVAVAAITVGITQAIALGQSLGQSLNQATVIAQAAVAEGLVGGGLGAKTQGAIADAVSDAFGRTAFYRIEYPEDTKTFGTSFNTQLGTTGWALQGELSYRQDVPVQINTIEIIGAILGAVSSGAAAVNQVGNFNGQFATDVPGFAELDILQVQTTATRLFGPNFGADESVLVAELGVTHVLDYPSQTSGGPNGNGLRLNGPNTGLGGNALLAPTANQAFAGQVLGSDHFVSETSWGYQIRGQLTYNNAIGAINLLPRLAWRHDVNGISPGPGENFLEGRKAVSVGLAATYLNTWRADVAYTNYFGAGDFNLINDRDLVAASLSYSF
ncbi:MAG: DUF1302 domain-containing protein [Pseudomonadota bacterium]